MPENMMNSEHKATTESYRDGYDRIFNKSGKTKGRKLSSVKTGYTLPTREFRTQPKEANNGRIGRNRSGRH